MNTDQNKMKLKKYINILKDLFLLISFAIVMWLKITKRRKRHGEWRQYDIVWLTKKLDEEVQELKEAKSHDDKAGEAVDVAAVAFMHRQKALRQNKHCEAKLVK